MYHHHRHLLLHSVLHGKRGNGIRATRAHGDGILEATMVIVKNMRRNVTRRTLKNKIGFVQRWISVMLTKPKGLKNSVGQLSLQIKTMMKKTHYLEAV
eukprot:5876117-Karenia_brevis.AAC.1